MTTQIKQVSPGPHKRLWGEFLIIFPHIWLRICPTQTPQIWSKWKGWTRQWTYSAKKLFGAPPASFSPASPSSKNGHARQPRLPRRQARPQSACALIPVNTPRCPSHWENKASLPVPYLLQVTIFSFLLSLFPSFLSEGKTCFFKKLCYYTIFVKMQQQRELDFLYPEGIY